MKQTAKYIVRRLIGERRYSHWLYRRYYKKLLAINGFSNIRAVGEAEYLAQWRRLYPYVEPYSYRLFSHFCGPTPDIIPEDILHHEIERRLNPPEHWAECEDKNRFAQYVGAELLPQTFASRSGGGAIRTTGHQPPANALILKPAVGSSCGDGVVKFMRQADGSYLSTDGQPLTEAYLMAYGSDFILQECVEQHPALASYCRTSLNTLRLAVYRSVSDGQPHITAASLRIGREGSVIDNASAGGRYLKVDLATGQLGRCTFNHDGCPATVWNGVDFARENAVVPSWDEVKQLAVDVAVRIPWHHLFAMDIAVRADGRPVLIEYNIGGFSSYFFHFTGQPVFGPYLPEVLEWVKEKSL